MTASVRNWCFGSMAIVLLLAGVAWAAEGRARSTKTGEYNPADQTVEMFAAIEKGDIAVKLIPKDSTQCRVLIENKTDKPLNVKLPEAFAGVPVLAQAGGGSSRSSSNTQQSMGGGMGGMGGGGMGMGGGGGGGGFFNVAPEKVGQLKVPTVCLEHGKREPHEQIPYEIKPLDSFTTKAGVHELCQLLSSGQINQRAAQAAAWHLSNNMSWEELAAKRLRFANGTNQPYFSQEEIQAGMKIAFASVRLSSERQKKTETTTKPQSTSQK